MSNLFDMFSSSNLFSSEKTVTASGGGGINIQELLYIIQY